MGFFLSGAGLTYLKRTKKQIGWFILNLIDQNPCQLTQKSNFFLFTDKNRNAKEISATIKSVTPKINNKKTNKPAKTTAIRNNDKQVKLIASFNLCK